MGLRNKSKRAGLKKWRIKWSLLSTPEENRPRARLSTPPSMASLVQQSVQAWSELNAHSPPSGDHPDIPRTTKKRAKNFPFAPDKTTLKNFKTFGFNDWLARVKKESSIEATTKQLGEFVAWFNQAKCVIFYMINKMCYCIGVCISLII